MLRPIRVVQGYLTVSAKYDIMYVKLKEGEIVDNDNIITSPAYMAVPGNIYNTILMDDDNKGCACGQIDGKDVAICLGVCLLVSVIICGIWLWIMHKEGC